MQPYAESQTAWAETAEGIGVITACSLVGLGLLIAVTYMVVRYCRHVKRPYVPHDVAELIVLSEVPRIVVSLSLSLSLL